MVYLGIHVEIYATGNDLEFYQSFSLDLELFHREIPVTTIYIGDMFDMLSSINKCHLIFSICFVTVCIRFMFLMHIYKIELFDRLCQGNTSSVSIVSIMNSRKKAWRRHLLCI